MGLTPALPTEKESKKKYHDRLIQETGFASGEVRYRGCDAKQIAYTSTPFEAMWMGQWMRDVMMAAWLRCC